MPHITLPIGPGGPLFDFICGVSKPRAEALQRAGQPVPPRVQVKGLIDTGASITSIDASVLQALCVISKGTVPIHTPSTSQTQPHIAAQFDISLILTHPMASRTWLALPVIEATLAHQGFKALIGRDILNWCLFNYDGQAKTFAIAF